jgi:membrane glycosyltransferase
MCLLLLPKILGAMILMQSSEKLRLCGGSIKVALGVLAETIYSMLMAPVLMLFYTRFVLSTFSGIGVRWGKQIRSDAGGPGWLAWVQTHGTNLVLALIATALVARTGSSLVLWLAPVLVGPLLAIPLSQITASSRLGIKAKNMNWFLIPEEVAPPDEVANLEEPIVRQQSSLFNSREYAPDYGLLQAVLDPYINSIHVSLLRLRAEANPRTRDSMELVADRLLLKGPFALTPAEKKTLLWDAETMLGIHQRLWSSPAFQLHDWWQQAFRHYVESSALFMRRNVVISEGVPSRHRLIMGGFSNTEASQASSN